MIRLKILLAVLAGTVLLGGCESRFAQDFQASLAQVGDKLSGTEVAPPEPTLYDQLTEQDVAKAAAAVQSALEKHPDQKPLSWRNKATGASGQVLPVRTRKTDTGVYCRDYQERLTVGGKSARYDNTACRNRAGRWVWTS